MSVATQAPAVRRSALARHQIVAQQLRVDQASLEDAFIALTGREPAVAQN